MGSLIADWCAYCEGKSDYDKSHFLGLIKNHPSDADLQTIFKYFPRTDQLCERVSVVLSSGTLANSLYLLPKAQGAESEILSAGKEWRLEIARVCNLLGDIELHQIAYSAKDVFVSPAELDRWGMEDIPNNWAFELIGDAVSDAKVSCSKEMYALFEALYGVAADYYLAYFMGATLIDLDIDFGLYFNLWKISGVGLLLEDKLILSSSAN